MEHIKRHSTSHNIGAKNPRATLEEADIHLVRRFLRDGSMNQSEIALWFGVSRSTISHIKTGRRWSHIQESSVEMGVSQ